MSNETFDWLTRLSYEQMLERERIVADNIERLMIKLAQAPHEPRKVIELDVERWKRRLVQGG